MGLTALLARVGRFFGGEPHADGASELHVGDPRFDDWKVVQDFRELEAARAFRQYLGEHGLDSVLTADWPLDEFGQGDIALRVTPERWGEAEALLEEP
jgi:hypothetical protein